MGIRSSSILSDILFILSDCKIHTIDELANEVEVSRSTIKRYIQSLSYRYPIQSFSGGTIPGGVYLEKGYVYQGKVLTRDELQVINQALTMLQNSENNEVNQELLKALLIRFTLPENKEQRNEGRENTRQCG